MSRWDCYISIDEIKKGRTKYIQVENKNKRIMNHWVLSKLILSQQTNMDCVDSYWFNWIKCNESCQNDSIEVVRSRFIRNMWFVDSSV